MNSQAIVHFAGFQGTDTQLLLVRAALIYLVVRQIRGLYLVRAVFHIHCVIKTEHRVAVVRRRAHAELTRGRLVIAVTEAVADAGAISDVLHQNARFGEGRLERGEDSRVPRHAAHELLHLRLQPIDGPGVLVQEGEEDRSDRATCEKVPLARLKSAEQAAEKHGGYRGEALGEERKRGRLLRKTNAVGQQDYRQTDDDIELQRNREVRPTELAPGTAKKGRSQRAQDENQQREFRNRVARAEQK